MEKRSHYYLSPDAQEAVGMEAFTGSTPEAGWQTRVEFANWAETVKRVEVDGKKGVRRFLSEARLRLKALSLWKDGIDWKKIKRVETVARADAGRMGVH